MIQVPLEVANAINEASREMREAFMALPDEEKERVCSEVTSEVERRMMEWLRGEADG